MGKVKSAFETAMEKAGKIGRLSSEEKENLKNEEMVKSILGEFYKGNLDSNGLWQKLKGIPSSSLKMVQINLIDSLSLVNAQIEFKMKKEGILAVETLKEKPNTAVIDSILDLIEVLQKEYQGMKESVAEDLKREIEKNPQLRMQPVRTPNGKTVMQAALSVDEAVKVRLSEFLSVHEKRYSVEFNSLIEKFKIAVR
ncbi:MAG: hypothetical protein A2Y97_04685 [Nitrospirae bacterium RBG_13_39_12]|nr:MAG: hypothetical protein A2Y97_04685 [Nitrospirae bacterium RBG_13_39_12]